MNKIDELRLQHSDVAEQIAIAEANLDHWSRVDREAREKQVVLINKLAELRQAANDASELEAESDTSAD